jgi:uncharacterized membrane protein
MRNRTERLWALTGPAFTVLFAAVIFVIVPDTPGEKASAQQVVDYYNSHQGRSVTNAFISPLLAALLLLFVAYLRSRTRGRGRSTTASIGPVVLVAGAVVWVSGALLGSVATLALTTSSDNGQLAAAETLNVLSNSLWIPFIAGIAVTMIGAALTVLSSDVLPRWMGWVALVAGVVSLAGPGGFIGFFVAPLWLLVAGILLYLRSEVTVPTMRQGDEATDESTGEARPTAGTRPEVRA